MGIQMEHQPRVLVVPYPAQGHINPMLQFSRRLASKGQHVTVVMTEAVLKRISQVTSLSFLNPVSPPAIQFDIISDGLAPDADRTSNVDQVLAQQRKMGSSSLSHLIENLNAAGSPISCIIYDSFLPWIIEVANNFNIPSAFFWTQSVAVYSIYYHFINGLIEDKSTDTIAIPGLPRLVMEEIPSFLRPSDSYKSILQLLEEQFRNISEATWVLGNSFYELESEALESLPSKIPRIRTVGPLIPSALLNGGDPQDTDFRANLWKAEDCIDWLNSKATSSVVYVSFGSMAVLSREQIHEIALGLQGSGHAFLWVLRPTHDDDIAADSLPDKFLEESNIKQGRVIPWCSQVQVLSHPAVGLFLSHCGWNSTLESLSFGVPLLAVPQWSDQTTNLKYVADVWKTGLRLNKRADGVVGKEEVERSIRKIMEGEEGIQLRKNALKWKTLAKEAMSGGGSSDRNIDQFVSEIVSTAALISSSSFSNMTSIHD